MNKEYVDFEIAPYSIVKVLLMLYRAKIYQYSITQEDNNLHIRISVEYLEKIDKGD